MRDYWVPKFKQDLVMWLCFHYNEQESKFKRMNKKQLLAIYFKTREAINGK